MLKTDKRAEETVWLSAPPISESFIFSNPAEENRSESDSDKVEGD